MNTIKLKIHGMHCSACEVRVERQFKKIAGVEKVNVNHATGKAVVVCSRTPTRTEFQQALADDEYTVTSEDDEETYPVLTKSGHPSKEGNLLSRGVVRQVSDRGVLSVVNTKRDYAEIGAVALILAGLYFFLQQFDVLPTNFAISEQMSYGVVFVIGLVAALSSCIAVTGGLLLAVAGKYNERHPELTGVQKFKPTLYFNTGRMVGYTVLGGLVGMLGSFLTFSAKVNGMVMVIASIVMIILGLQLLNLFVWLKRLQPRMPKILAHKIHEVGDSSHKAAPFLLGMATFFLPCGFTQALQLYVLAQGSFATGALTMFVFSLGTMPALLSLSAVSSFAQGSFRRYFMKFSGVLVIFLGIFNINNGFALTGSSLDLNPFHWTAKSAARASIDPNVEFVDGKQVVDMKVVGLEYVPSRFAVQAGVPVEWRIDGRKAQGCAQVITLPKLGITKYLSANKVTTIEFTPQEPGRLAFSCTMGMTTPGAAFEVVKGESRVMNQESGDVDSVGVNGRSPVRATECNSDIMNCIPAQKLMMEVTRERGVYPYEMTVKKDLPVELTIDAKVPMGGCMSVWVIPEYDVTIPMKVGLNTAIFTPTKTGTFALTCSMGSRMAQLTVVD